MNKKVSGSLPYSILKLTGLTLFLIALLLPSGLYFLSQQTRLLIHQNRVQLQISNQKACSVLTISTYDYNKLSNKHEIYWQGDWYDVVSVQKSANQMVLHLIKDCWETELKEVLFCWNRLENSNHMHSLMQWFLGWKALHQETGNLNQNYIVNTSHYGEQPYFLKEGQELPIIKPPC